MILIPASASAITLRLVRELSSSTLYHVMEGLGLATAMQMNMTEAGWVTVNAIPYLMVGVAGGTAKRLYWIVIKYHRAVYCIQANSLWTISSKSIVFIPGMAALVALHW